MQIGLGSAGGGAEAAQVTTVLGERSGPVGAAWISALAAPAAGFATVPSAFVAPFVVVARPGLPVLPPTLFVPRCVDRGAGAGEPAHGSAVTVDRLARGAVQAGVAEGVIEALATELIDVAQLDRLVLIVTAWIDSRARDEHALHRNHRDATVVALRAGADRSPSLHEVLAARGDVSNHDDGPPTSRG
jgi:5,6,7,8-tetrahydromethanopterin hydro-lyase